MSQLITERERTTPSTAGISSGISLKIIANLLPTGSFVARPRFSHKPNIWARSGTPYVSASKAKPLAMLGRYRIHNTTLSSQSSHCVRVRLRGTLLLVQTLGFQEVPHTPRTASAGPTESASGKSSEHGLLQTAYGPAQSQGVRSRWRAVAKSVLSETPESTQLLVNGFVLLLSVLGVQRIDFTGHCINNSSSTPRVRSEE